MAQSLFSRCETAVVTKPLREPTFRNRTCLFGSFLRKVSNKPVVWKGLDILEWQSGELDTH